MMSSLYFFLSIIRSCIITASFMQIFRIILPVRVGILLSGGRQQKTQTFCSVCVFDMRQKSFYFSVFAKNWPVKLRSHAAHSSGVPSNTISPPPSPPSGPKSMIWSAVFITSRLCSMTSTVLPASVSRFNTSISLCTSAVCSPVVGSSRTYSVLPVLRFHSSVASFTLCASPPESVVEFCPSFI